MTSQQLPLFGLLIEEERRKGVEPTADIGPSASTTYLPEVRIRTKFNELGFDAAAGEAEASNGDLAAMALQQFNSQLDIHASSRTPRGPKDLSLQLTVDILKMSI